MMSPLERMYPNRCFDCLAPCPHEKMLCAACENVYAQARQRPDSSSTGGES